MKVGSNRVFISRARRPMIALSKIPPIIRRCMVRPQSSPGYRVVRDETAYGSFSLSLRDFNPQPVAKIASKGAVKCSQVLRVGRQLHDDTFLVSSSHRFDSENLLPRDCAPTESAPHSEPIWKHFEPPSPDAPAVPEKQGQR